MKNDDKFLAGCLGFMFYLLLIPVLWYTQAYVFVTVLSWHFLIEITLVQAWIGAVLLAFIKPDSLSNFYSLDAIKKAVGAEDKTMIHMWSSLGVRFTACAIVLFFGWVGL